MLDLKVTPISEIIGIATANMPKEAGPLPEYYGNIKTPLAPDPRPPQPRIKGRFAPRPDPNAAPPTGGTPVVDNRGNEWDMGGTATGIETEGVGGETTQMTQTPPAAAPTALSYEEGQSIINKPKAVDPNAADQPVQDADPNTPGFQAPEFADPQMAQQMQRMHDENQRNKQFDEWATNSGFTSQQISQLRSGLNPQMGGGYQPRQGFLGGLDQGLAGGAEPQEQPTFLGDVGRGAAGGAALGGIGGGMVGGGIGAIPGAAAGAAAGGIAGGAKNLWNKGKNMWNQFQNFRQQPQQQRRPGIPYTTSSRPSLVKIAKQQSEKRIVVAFLKTLDNDYERMVFLEYLRAGLASLERPRPVLTAAMGSASALLG